MVLMLVNSHMRITLARMLALYVMSMHIDIGNEVNSCV